MAAAAPLETLQKFVARVRLQLPRMAARSVIAAISS
jgi:hypothetical protein